MGFETTALCLAGLGLPRRFLPQNVRYIVGQFPRRGLCRGLITVIFVFEWLIVGIGFFFGLCVCCVGFICCRILITFDVKAFINAIFQIFLRCVRIIRLFVIWMAWMQLKPRVAAGRTLNIPAFFRDHLFGHFVLCRAVRADQPHLDTCCLLWPVSGPDFPKMYLQIQKGQSKLEDRCHIRSQLWRSR